jgi:hypothetical protein
VKTGATRKAMLSIAFATYLGISKPPASEAGQ